MAEPVKLLTDLLPARSQLKRTEPECPANNAFLVTASVTAVDKQMEVSECPDNNAF